MGTILTPEILDRAFALTEPSALAILRKSGTTWGPKMVVGLATGPGIYKPKEFTFGIDELWDPAWGPNESEFWQIAKAKLAVVERLRMSTSVVVATMPWMLEPGEFLYAGGVYDHGISVAFSGAKGWADEAIAKILLVNIIMLAMLETERRIEAKEKKI